MRYFFGGKTEEELAAQKAAEEDAQAAQDLLAQRPGMVTRDLDEIKRVQSFRAEQKAAQKEREAQVRQLKERRALVNNPTTQIGDDLHGVQPVANKHFDLGDKNRPEVQAVMEKLATPKPQPREGMLGLFKQQAQERQRQQAEAEQIRDFEELLDETFEWRP